MVCLLNGTTEQRKFHLKEHLFSSSWCFRWFQHHTVIQAGRDVRIPSPISCSRQAHPPQHNIYCSSHAYASSELLLHPGAGRQGLAQVTTNRVRTLPAPESSKTIKSSPQGAAGMMEEGLQVWFSFEDLEWYRTVGLCTAALNNSAYLDYPIVLSKYYTYILDGPFYSTSCSRCSCLTLCYVWSVEMSYRYTDILREEAQKMTCCSVRGCSLDRTMSEVLISCKSLPATK